VVEIYRVFPKDSDVGRTSGPPTFSTPQVPTRANPPSDVELVDELPVFMTVPRFFDRSEDELPVFIGRG
jgi:hypothetical protein